MFTLIVLATAVFVCFATDFSEFGKKAWLNLPFRNFSMLFLMSLFGVHYNDVLKDVFLSLIDFFNETSTLMITKLPKFEGVQQFTQLFFLLLSTYVLSLSAMGLYWLVYRETQPYHRSMIFGFWVFFAILFVLA